MNMIIATIPTNISTIEPDKNGRIFNKESMDTIFRNHGFLRPNQKDRIPISPIPIRFFIDVTDYCDIMRIGYDVTRDKLATETFTINQDITEEEFNAMQIMYMNSRYYINLPMAKVTYEKHKDYLTRCRANMICSELHAVDGLKMGATDILYLDVFPEK